MAAEDCLSEAIVSLMEKAQKDPTIAATISKWSDDPARSEGYVWTAVYNKCIDIGIQDSARGKREERDYWEETGDPEPIVVEKVYADWFNEHLVALGDRTTRTQLLREQARTVRQLAGQARSSADLGDLDRARVRFADLLRHLAREDGRLTILLALAAGWSVEGIVAEELARGSAPEDVIRRNVELLILRYPIRETIPDALGRPGDEANPDRFLKRIAATYWRMLSFLEEAGVAAQIQEDAPETQVILAAAWLSSRIHSPDGKARWKEHIWPLLKELQINSITEVPEGTLKTQITRLRQRLPRFERLISPPSRIPDLDPGSIDDLADDLDRLATTPRLGDPETA